ncbi:MAG: GGDEF domain-containing protein [Dehalococcoidia bacterium]
MTSTVPKDQPFALEGQDRDELTGLYTRAAANLIVRAGVREANEKDGAISIALLDVDRFEAFDEEHGLMAGDALLRRVAGVLVTSDTGAEAIARYSRDTFLLIFPGKEPEDALLVAERTRAFFDANPPTLEVKGKKLQVQVSLSSGVASFPSQAHDDRDLLRKAQGALLRAKEMGRGRTNLWQRSKETRMYLKTSYFAQTQLDQLSELADELSRSEASLLREALDDLLWKYYSRRVRTVDTPGEGGEEKR